jgi:1-acyl-sn-glycerol-3-phosphate acyltransferase
MHRDTSPRDGPVFQLAMRVCWLLARVVFCLRLALRGAEHLPRDADGRLIGSWIAAPVPHVRWIDPFLLLLVLPRRPRLVFLADGRHLYRTRFRRILFRLVGGVVPVWPRRGGADAFRAHVSAAQQIVQAGAVFTIFPDGGRPARPHGARPIRAGLGYIGLRTGAQIVPIVIGGADELYRGRRLVVQLLPPVEPNELAGLPVGSSPPQPQSGDERAAAHRLTEALTAMTGPHVSRGDQYAFDPLRRWQGFHWSQID